MMGAINLQAQPTNVVIDCGGTAWYEGAYTSSGGPMVGTLNNGTATSCPCYESDDPSDNTILVNIQNAAALSFWVPYVSNDGTCSGSGIFTGPITVSVAGPQDPDCDITTETFTTGACMAEVGSPPPNSVPTLGQWGIILFTLLLLTLSTVVLLQKEMNIGTSGANFSLDIREIPFNKTLFMRLLAGVLVTALVVFSMAIVWGGYELTNADMPGTLVCAPILAYLLSLMEYKK